MDVPEDKPTEVLYSLWEAQRILGGISHVTMWRLTRDGELPTVQIGRRRFVAASDLNRFIEERRVSK